MSCQRLVEHTDLFLKIEAYTMSLIRIDFYIYNDVLLNKG